MSEILGIFGLQGWGKTALTTYFGMLAKEQGLPIYSNYPLKFDYIPVTTIKEAQSCRNGCLLLDEIWKWVHARTSQSNINKEMMGICLLNRKRGVSPIVYNSQLPRTVDVILKDVTTFRYVPHILTHEDGLRYIHYTVKDIIDRESEEMIIPVAINEIGKYFDTHYEIDNLTRDKDLTGLEKGIGLEKDFNNVLNKSRNVLFTKLQPNSGRDCDYPFDILSVGIDENYAFDVKSSFNSGRISITEYGKAFENKVNSIKRSNKFMFQPYFAFPRIDTKFNTRAYDWYICSMIDNFSYFRRMNSMPYYYHLIKKSILLSKSNLFSKDNRSKHLGKIREG